MQQTAAIGTGFLEPGVAVRTDNEIRLDFPFAAGTDQAFLDILKQRFLFQRTFVSFYQGFLGAQDEIEEKPRQVEDQDHEGGQKLGKDVSGPRADIAESPDDHADPKGQDLQRIHAPEEKRP